MANRVICIGRQNGAGGHIIGEALAKKLGIAFYDKNLITLAAERSGLSPELIEHGEERKTNSFLYNTLGEAATITIDSVPHTDVTFAMQRDLIIEAARTHDCVIIGRCSDTILRATPAKVLSVFIAAPFEDRVQNKIKLEGRDYKSLAPEIRKTDKRRRAYYNYNTGNEWGLAENYDVCLNSSTLGIDGCVELLAAYFDKM
jgi:cytidylate kinase